MAEALKEENDSLRWQLDAYRNEVELLKQEQGKAPREDDPNKEQQLKLLQQALQGMQQHLLKVQEEYKKKEAELEKLKDDKLQVEKMLENLKEKSSLLKKTRGHTSCLLHLVKQIATSKTHVTQTKLLLEKFMTVHYEVIFSGKLICDQIFQPDTIRLGSKESRTSRLGTSNQDSDYPLEKTMNSSPIKSEREALLVGQLSPLMSTDGASADPTWQRAFPESLWSKYMPLEVFQVTGYFFNTSETKQDGTNGIISTFLHVHPFGASIEYICSYLQRLDNKSQQLHGTCIQHHQHCAAIIQLLANPGLSTRLTPSLSNSNSADPVWWSQQRNTAGWKPLCQHTQRHKEREEICTSDVERLMGRLQHTFKQEMTGVGASLEKRWKFCGFEGLKLT
ncbi:hypothetical protein P7K49_039075 [Saguinus oedipus]|uniref:Ecto-NOX disulfide-thiol exchanger 1/2 domain-containing protein n=1 Tax=Saguinus oedipus TaxID=9490 RepID=A0ABQ9TGH3_SAGOE|nr:hypothetical protein P7K49_039075 [Saguinus oedipus]